ncbi:MAG: guanylate kinase [Kiritimatiellae bacterium]|nr:guanylate kinase [Kiritimatiellia bacterium]
MKSKSLFIVISAPSGCGKTTLVDMLLQEYPEIGYSVSCTTRAPRKGEEDGIDYHFLSEKRFKELLAQSAFLEWAEVHGNYYGTLLAPIEDMLNEGSSVLLDIDVAGAAKIREYIHSLLKGDPLREGFMDVFILPPDMEELRRRLEGRGTDSPETIEKRLANAEKEIARAGEYLYRVTNDDLGIAYRRLVDLIEVAAGRQ